LGGDWDRYKKDFLTAPATEGKENENQPKGRRGKSRRTDWRKKLTEKGDISQGVDRSYPEEYLAGRGKRKEAIKQSGSRAFPKIKGGDSQGRTLQGGKKWQ